MRGISGPDPRCHQVQLPAVRSEPVLDCGGAAQVRGVPEPRLQPPPGYKGHHRAGHLVSRHVVLARQPRAGLGVAPGMQGVQVQQFTKNMLTPESLAELMGGPDLAVIPPAGPPEALRPTTTTGTGSPAVRTTRRRRRGIRSRHRRHRRVRTSFRVRFHWRSKSVGHQRRWQQHRPRRFQLRRERDSESETECLSTHSRGRRLRPGRVNGVLRRSGKRGPSSP